MGIYTPKELGLPMLKNVDLKEQKIPTSFTEILNLYSDHPVELYQYCDVLSEEAEQIITGPFKEDFDRLTQSKVSSLNIDDIYDYLGINNPTQEKIIATVS